MKRMHQKMESDENKTALRLLYYPAVGDQLKEGQVRCGEHSDYGSITLLFQDNVGGLEVSAKNRNVLLSVFGVSFEELVAKQMGFVAWFSLQQHKFFRQVLFKKQNYKASSKTAMRTSSVAENKSN